MYQNVQIWYNFDIIWYMDSELYKIVSKQGKHYIGHHCLDTILHNFDAIRIV